MFAVRNAVRTGLVRRSKSAVACSHRGQAGRTRTGIKMDPELYRHSTVMPKERGVDLLHNAHLNKGMGFSLRERQLLGIHGLLPPAFFNQEQQAERVMENLRRQESDLARYVQLSGLQDRNEHLFYKVLMDYTEELMPIVYTPTVGLACQKFGYIFRKPKGMYITIHDYTVEHIYEMLCNWPDDDVRAIVVTDGERILGLGDLGAYGMGIPIGKLSLYIALAGIYPQWTLPITLDVGTNNEELLNDPFYIGLRQKRVRGEKYDQFIDNFMQAVVKRYGHDTLIQFEDFGNQNAFRLLEKYKENYCTFNDDIQGTASVAVAGLMAAIRATGKKVSENKFLFYGAGEAAIGIAKLSCMAMEAEGLSAKEARSRIFMVDSRGLIVKGRDNLTRHKEEFCQDMPHIKDLAEIVKTVKPTGLIGAAAQPKVFTESILRDMAAFNEKPIIFALSNPTSKAECTAEEAYTITEGRCVFASGSPFGPVTLNGQTFHPGQGNNAYIFPGVALGTLLCGARHITETMFLIASQTCAGMVTDKHLSEGRLYPPLGDIREISIKIATAVMEHSYNRGRAAFYPEPADKEKFVRAQVYGAPYEKFTPMFYDWPKDALEAQHPNMSNITGSLPGTSE